MHCRVANGHLDSISHLCWRRLSTSFFFQDRQEIYRKKAQALLPCCGSLQLHSLTSWLLWLHLEIYWGRYCWFFSTEIPLFNTAVQYGRSIHRRLAARAKDHQNGCSNGDHGFRGCDWSMTNGAGLTGSVYWVISGKKEGMHKNGFITKKISEV